MLNFQIMTQTGEQRQVDQETIEAFAAKLRGKLLQPGDDGYDEARTIWNGMIDKRPSLIARCTGVADVTQAVNFARENKLLVSVRGGGHNVAGSAVCEGGLMIDLSLMKGIHVDPEARTARAQPGVNWGDLDRETQLFGLATPGGLISMTGIAGFTLGGGFGWLSRQYGFACDNLLSADVVTADGRFVRASTTENKDLFWGIRGGGGNFGIVTSFEYQLFPVGPTVLGGVFLYPLDRASEVMPFYRDFAAQAPDELGSQVFLRLAPPLPFVSEAFHGKPIVGIAFCYAGSLAEGERVIQPIKDLGQSVGTLCQTFPYAIFQSMFDAGQPDGHLYYWKSEYLPGLSDEVIETGIDYAARITSPLSAIMMFHLSGAAGRVDKQALAAGHRDAAFVLNINTCWAEPQATDKHIQWTRDLWTAMQPYSIGGGYVNFFSADEGEDRVKAAYSPEKYERLVALKNKYDPSNFFRLNQNIKPTIRI
jgi:FAD/FMN-containing dehydrogenase